MASVMLGLDWRTGMYELPVTWWLMVGWLLVSVGAVTLLAFLLRLLRYSLGESIVERSARGAAALDPVPVRSDSRSGAVRRAT